MASKALSRIAKGSAGAGRGLLLAPSQLRRQQLHRLSSGFHPTGRPQPTSRVPCSVKLQKTVFGNSTLQQSGFAFSTSSPSSEPAEEANQSNNEEKTVDQASVKVATDDTKKHERNGNSNTSSISEENTVDQASEKAVTDGTETEETNGNSGTSSVRNRKSTKRIAFSDSEEEETEVSFDDLVKLVNEKEELLKLKHKEIEKMQDKVLRSYAEMENVLDRTKREAENAKKFAIQNFAKSLLDVADNLGRASSVVKERFSKIDTSNESSGAAPLLKTLLEGVDMTEKQLAEVFRKFGIEKYDPINERFDPHRHHALFQIPDASKPPGTVAAVLKVGYTLHDRIIRPAEVGVIEGSSDGDEEQRSES